MNHSKSTVEIDAPKRRGDWLQTFTNVQFWPLDPRVSEIRLEDIAHALSNLCRFGGHSNSFYSVAQHSVLVAQHLPRELALQGLFHDATEAYLVDVPSPIKRHLSGYIEMEVRLARVIGEHFNVSLDPMHPEVNRQDVIALHTEKRDLKGPAPAKWSREIPVLWAETIRPWGPFESEARFLMAARQLGIAREG